ncbi:uncharacterized protein A4U43_C01F33670 [Asparagus officinalis]|uniref:DYW domain-containing protein n=1 Tax=Asparagus officinalis TaxID=4686 RepID=A0A5P1FU70_ASPOF|nr:uncharacterized protein A4U43_C01F33670 [Asparagus officinalis]
MRAQNPQMRALLHAHLVKTGSFAGHSPHNAPSASTPNPAASPTPTSLRRAPQPRRRLLQLPHQRLLPAEPAPPSPLQPDAGPRLLPNAVTFADVFTVAARCSAGGREAHFVALKTGSCDDVFVGSSLLNMYCKLGLVPDARKVFDRMHERNSVTWAAMVSGYAGGRCGVEGFELFRLMVGGDECSPNEFVITSVLSAVSLPEFVQMGIQVHGCVIKNGLASFVAVENSLVTFYSKCECLDDAARVFFSSGDRTPITWSAMVTGYAQNGEPLKALRLFLRMQSEGVRPSEFTFVGVLSACSDMISFVEGKQIHAYLVKLGFELQAYVKSALVDMYAKCGNLDDARKGFEALNEACGVDTVLWTAMIGGYVSNGQEEEALALFVLMQKDCILPNNLTFATAFRACSSLAALEQGKQIHALALKYGFGLGIPLGSALSTMYAKSGNLDDCRLVFRKMPQRDVVAWNSIISGFSQNGFGMEALDLFEEMKLDGVEPDDVTFINLLFACSHMGLVERGWSYFKSMYDEHGLAPKLEHYACMVDILSRAGLLEKAKNFVESVPIDHRTCLWRIVLGACRKPQYFDIGAYAGERLMELGSRDSSAYNLLSNIYAAWRRWDDVERVRRMMKLRGVSKDPGCSWLELHNRVHVFVAGEHLHPEIVHIYTEVKKLVKHMKDESYHPASSLSSQDYLELHIDSSNEEELPLLASIGS